MNHITNSYHSDFSIYNIPFGVAHYRENYFAVTRLGDLIINLSAMFEHNIIQNPAMSVEVLKQSTLNDFIALGKTVTNAVRSQIIDYLSFVEEIKQDFLLPSEEIVMVLPIKIGDYTDFYSSREHATNVGIMFRDPANALLPNWLHLPVGYHGRSSSIVVSGTDIIRPKGQVQVNEGEAPIFTPSRLLDFELEMAFVIGKETEMGTSISTKDAEDYIFGLMLFNDWSARDIQKWEYVPLGPFLAKNFASTLSPWIVTLEALEPFRVQGPAPEKELLPYLHSEGPKNYDIHLEVAIATETGVTTVSNSNFKYMYWNMCQQLAHHTVNGCNVRVGDLLASGTISGPTPDSYGSMLEITWRGSKPITMHDGSERKFIQDGDTVKMKGWAEKDGKRVGFGECDGKILAAR